MIKSFALLTMFQLLQLATVFAQDPNAQPIVEVNYEKIEKAVSDPTSDYFFPKLKERLDRNDTTMTLMDYHYYYYGYTFQPAYNSIKRNENDTLKNLKSKDALSEVEFQELLNIELKWLEEMPIDLEAHYWVLVALEGMGKQDEFIQWKRRFNGLLDAVVASGDGLTKETAIHIAFVRDEYFFLEMFGLRYAGEQQLNMPCDYLKVVKNDFEIEGMYFNVARHFACMSKQFGFDKKD